MLQRFCAAALYTRMADRNENAIFAYSSLKQRKNIVLLLAVFNRFSFNSDMVCGLKSPVRTLLFDGPLIVMVADLFDIIIDRFSGLELANHPATF
jgi:hypothetical protein